MSYDRIYNKQTDRQTPLRLYKFKFKDRGIIRQNYPFQAFFTHLHNCKQFFLDVKTEFTITLALRGTRARVCSAL